MMVRGVSGHGAQLGPHKKPASRTAVRLIGVVFPVWKAAMATTIRGQNKREIVLELNCLEREIENGKGLLKWQLIILTISRLGKILV